MNKLFKQIIKFGVVGGIAFIIDYSLLFILTELTPLTYFYASIISFIVSLTFNYILSIKWVFDVNKKQDISDIIIFVALSVVGLLINQIIMYIFVEKVHIYYMITKIISTIVVMIYNFITRKIFIEK